MAKPDAKPVDNPNDSDVANDSKGGDNKTTPPVDSQKTGSTDEKKVEDQSQVDFGDWSDPEKTKAYVKKLREENARYRVKAKDSDSKSKAIDERYQKMEEGFRHAFGLSEDIELTEENFGALQEQSRSLSVENEILKIAVEHQIPGDKIDYFQFLVTKSLGQLKEGEELSSEDIGEILGKVMPISGTGSSTSITSSGTNGNSPNPNSGNEVSLDQFCAMSITEKSLLFQKDADAYGRLLKIARTAGRLI